MTIGLRRPVFVFLLCCCPTWDKVLASSYFMFPSVSKSGTVLSSAVKYHIIAGGLHPGGHRGAEQQHILPMETFHTTVWSQGFPLHTGSSWI